MTRRILIVDNDPQPARLAALLAARYGYESEVVTGGREAILRVTRAPDDYSCVLTDYGMTPLNGVDVAAAIRANPDAAHIRIVLLSGAREMDDMLATGHFDAALQKPFEFDSLMEIFRTYAGAPSKSMRCHVCNGDVGGPDAPYDAAVFFTHLRDCLQPPIEPRQVIAPVADEVDEAPPLATVRLRRDLALYAFAAIALVVIVAAIILF
ncbi:MAG TPA: response regulator [Thermoanaerobaculia bacterium]